MVITIDKAKVPSLRSFMFGGLGYEDDWNKACDLYGFTSFRTLRVHPDFLVLLDEASTVKGDNQLRMPKGRNCRFGAIGQFIGDDTLEPGVIILSGADGNELVRIINIPLNVWAPHQIAAGAHLANQSLSDNTPAPLEH